MRSIGELITILPPFGDGETAYEITNIMAINDNGEEDDGSNVAYYQYEINGCYYAEQFIGE